MFVFDSTWKDYFLSYAFVFGSTWKFSVRIGKCHMECPFTTQMVTHNSKIPIVI